MEKIKAQISKLRSEVNHLTSDLYNCDKEKLLKVSQALDKVICDYIKAEAATKNSLTQKA